MIEIETLNKNLIAIKTNLYDPLSFNISNVDNELEGTAYDTCQFEQNENKKRY